MKRLIKICAIFLFLFVPSAAFATQVEGTFLIPDWSAPVVNGNYPFGNNVIVSGDWQLPPEWGGIIYVYGDGVFGVDDLMTVPGAQMTDIDNGNTYYELPVNATEAPTAGTFSFNIGPQTAGTHNVYITFWGGTKCAINQALNVRDSVNIYSPTCSITAENFASNITWHYRNYTVAIPDYASMVLTPDADPALDFLNVELGQSPTQSFTIKNTGGRLLQGNVSGIAPPLSCVNCSYVLNPGQSKTVSIKYTPTTAPSAIDQTLTFSCKDNTTADCRKILNDFSTSLQPQETRHVVGNAVANSVPPSALIDVGSTLDFGTIYIGGAGPAPFVDKTVNVKNTGGGYLNGTIALSSSEYKCIDNSGNQISCDYNIIAGTSKDIKIRFTPTAVGSHSDTATFTGVALPPVVNLTSQVTNIPILSFSWANSPVVSERSVNFGTINVSSCSDIGVSIYNIGGGLLSGTFSGIPIKGWTDTENGFSCVWNCTYSNLSHGAGVAATLRFCPTGAAPLNETAILSNDVSAPNGGTINLTGSGNTNSILQVTDANGNLFVSGSTINFGDVRLETISSPKSLTIKNVGVGNIHYDANLGNAGDQKYFNCTANCDGDLGAGQSKTVSFTFNPTDAGGVRAYTVTNFSVVVAFGYKINLTGNGVKPAFYLHAGGNGAWPDRSPQWCATGSPAPMCMPPGPKTLDVGTTIFSGDATSGVQNKKFSIYAMNLGLGGNTTYTFPSTPHFVCIAGYWWNGTIETPNKPCTGGTLSPWSTTWDHARIEYEFRPDAPGDYDEPLVITYNNGDGDQQMTLNLKGHSINSAYLGVTPSSVNLGNITIENTATAIFTVKNLGGSPLNGSVTMPAAGVNYASFTCVEGCTYDNIAPLATHTVKISLIPTVSGAHSISPIFTSDASNGSVIRPISGTGVIAPVIDVNPANLTFLDTNLGSSRTLDVIVSNTGIGNLVYGVTPVANISGVNPNEDFYCVTNCTSVTVAQGGSVLSTVKFKPRSGISGLSRTITFNSNAVNGTPAGQKTVLAMGNGVFVPILDPRGADTNFGSVIVTKSREQTFTVRNVGVEDIPDGTFVITGASPIQFICTSVEPDNKCHYHLPAGGETAITIKFSPTSLGNKQAIISLSGMPAAQFVVQGRGIPPNVDFIENPPR